MANILVLGGTGIVGSSIASKAIERGHTATVTGIEPNVYGEQGIAYINYKNKALLQNRVWDAVVDVYTFDENHSDNVYETFKGNCKQIFIISSTLVYDRTTISFERILSDHRRARIGTQGGYVDHKIKLEEFWEDKTDIHWTILRPYHILGVGSHLGCLPPHNRDPDLLKEILTKRRIRLCDGGRVPLNIVNPKDIGEVVIRSISNDQTHFKAYNVVNPQEVIARDYYTEIADIHNLGLMIDNIPAEHIWRLGDWKLTTLPHIYDTSDLERDIGFVPQIGLRESLKEAIQSQPRHMSKKESQVYKRMHLPPEPMLNRYYD